jgi:Caspase domain
LPGTVYALLVGIDAYQPPINALDGCRNDVANLETFLRARVVDRPLDLKTLLDDEATRLDVIEAFRSHLGQAGPGDVALFVFDGHGSEEPAPPEFAPLEPSGRLQVLVCVDTGRRVGGRLSRGIADKELAVLIRDVASRGPHVAVILDCCHSGDGTRNPEGSVRQWIPRPDQVQPEHRDVVSELASARSLDAFLSGTVESWSDLPHPRGDAGDAGDDGGAGGVGPQPARADHVALSACQSFEVAKELPDGTQTTGVFSAALLTTLQAMGPGATYRELLAAARGQVERRTTEQTPVLYPVSPGGPGDGLILDGTIRRGTPSFLVTTGSHGFEVDAGLVHGLREPVGGEHFELTCTTLGGEPAGQVRVTTVGVGESDVEPIGWTPTEPAYRAVVSVVPLPRALVLSEDEEGGELVRHAVETCGPDGGPSVHLRLGDPADDPDALVLRITVHPDGYETQRDTPGGPSITRVDGPCVRLLRADHTPLTADLPGADSAAVRRGVALAEHVAQWEQLRALTAPSSALADHITLELFDAGSAEAWSGEHEPLVAAGSYELWYRLLGGGYVPPRIFLRVGNTADRPLYVAVLDLTDRFACSTALFPTQRIAAGHRVLAWEGAPIPVDLPSGRQVEPGASARDWIKVVVSESDFEASAFELHALDEPRRPRRTVRRASSPLDQLARRALTRELSGAAAPSGRSAALGWATRTIPVVTRVPHP